MASTSSGSSRFTAPAAVTITSLSALGPTRASTLSPRLAPKSRAALSPRARRVPSGSSATGNIRARPWLVTAATAAAVDDISRASIRSWRPGEASRAPATGIRPRLSPRARRVPSGSSATGNIRARPWLVTAATAAAVDDISRASIRSWRPGEASRAPATGIRPRLPLVDRVTTQGSSAAEPSAAAEGPSAAGSGAAMSAAAMI